MMNSNQVDDFMSKLSKQTSNGNQKSRVFNYQTRKIEKLSLNHPEHLGRYQVIPFNNVVTNFPYLSGQVKQINLPRKTIDQSGQESVYNAWIHIPAPGFYQMLDMSGRTVSSLTTEDENLLATASTLWEELYTELDCKNRWSETKDIIRRRNYTLFTGYCLNFWKAGSANNRVPDRQNFSALFMITTRGFMDNVENNINDKSIMEGGDKSWVDKIYNNDLTNRDGFILFSINRAQDRAGFTSSVQHEFGRSQMLSGIEIPKEDFEAGMEDAMSLFLGWQASNLDNDKPYGCRRLFNANLIKETCNYMSNLLASIRAAKVNGADIDKTIEDVNKKYADTIEAPRRQVDSQGQPNVQQPQAQPQVEDRPSSAQIDPMGGTVNPGFSNPTTAPGFTTPTDFSTAAPGFDPSASTPF